MKELFKVILYQPLFNILAFLTGLMPGDSVGWAIVTLTLLVRIALIPSSAKATKSQKEMKLLAPKLEEIKKKYKDDRQGEATATMELYKEHGVSPWGSCLPLLIQLPILWVLYRVFMVGLNTDRYDLLYSFVPAPETINTMFFGINLAQPDKWVLPILAGLAQLLQSWQMKQLNPVPKSDPNNRDKTTEFSNMLTGQMMYIMPIFTVIIAMRLPAALALYWFVTTLFMVGQTWWITRKDKTNNSILITQNSKEDSRFKTHSSRLKSDNKKDKKASEIEEESKPKKKSGLAEKLADRATRYKGRKDVEITIRKKS